jgi:hypothetical protein
LASNFGITQVVDENWGVHAIIKKDIFARRRDLIHIPRRPPAGARPRLYRSLFIQAGAKKELLTLT